jgi:hypothetical protein
MSDYSYAKVVRYPLKPLMEMLNVQSPEECEEYLHDKLGNLPHYREGFKIEGTDKNFYLDFVYKSSYGEESGDFGNVREITDVEFELIAPYFEKVFINIERDLLRIVEYCYYNCCECTDYYDLPDKNGDVELIKKVLN